MTCRQAEDGGQHGRPDLQLRLRRQHQPHQRPGQAERTTSDPASADPTTALHGMQGLVMETTAGASTSYIRDAGGGLIAERTPVGDFYYVYDGQGSVIALVDPDGTQRAAYTYDPYGDHATATPMNGSLPPNPWRWSGSYLDGTGLYKMGARYYDPTLGRFTQVDPVEGGSCNDYEYACGDPVNGRDLTGLAMEPLPAELYDACMNLISGGPVDPRSPACDRYRQAVVSGDSDFYYRGGPRPVRHGFNRAVGALSDPRRLCKYHDNMAVSVTARSGAAIGPSAGALIGSAWGPAGAATGIGMGFKVGTYAQLGALTYQAACGFAD